LARETIAAIATPLSPAGIGIIRISGPESFSLLRKFTGRDLSYFSGRALKPVKLYSARGQLLDRCLAVYMPAPHSYTGEDVVELHCHGSPPLLEATLEELIESGARLAGPGEFSKRAYLNGKLDLSQAEAILTLVNAGSLSVANAALAQLEGGLSLRLASLQEQIRSLLVGIEGALDFPDDVPLDEKEISTSLRQIKEEIDRLKLESANGEHAQHLPLVAIVGRVNVGNSSLFNALLKKERAIVTDISGTTRDIVEADLKIKGMTVSLADSAGLGKVEDRIDELAEAKARALINDSDLVIFLVDISRLPLPEDEEILQSLDLKKVILVGNKVDLGESMGWSYFPLPLRLTISALNGQGIKELEEIIGEEVEALLPSSNCWFLSLKQKEALAVSGEAIARVCEYGLDNSLDMLSADLREAYAALTEITGQEPSAPLIEEIFSRFCVGK